MKIEHSSPDEHQISHHATAVDQKEEVGVGLIVTRSKNETGRLPFPLIDWNCHALKTD